MKYLFKYTILIIILHFLSVDVLSQKSFIKGLNNVRISGNYLIRQTSDGGWITAASSPSFHTDLSKNGLMLVKYSKCADVEWSKYFIFDNKSYYLADFLIENNGNILVLGYTNLPSCEINILLLNSIGNTLWNKKIISNLVGIAYSIGKTSDNNYFLYGMCNDIQNSLPRNYILKFSPSGNIIWSYNYYANPVWGEAVAVEAGNILVRSGSLIYKVNQSGAIVWGKQYTGLYYACKPVVDNNGYTYVRYSSSLNDSTCNVFKIGLSGDLLFNGAAFAGNQLGSMKKINNGNLLIVGYHKSSNSVNIIECSTTGNLIRQRLVSNGSSLSPETGCDFIQLADNALIITGKSYNTNNPFLIKTDEKQNVRCGEKNINTSFTSPSLNVSGVFDQNWSNNVFLDHANLSVQNINPTEITSCYIADTLNLELGNDTTLCSGTNLTLKSNISGNFRFLWSTGETTPQINVNTTGTYWLKVIGCDTITDSIKVSFRKALNINYSINPKITDLGKSVTFQNYTSGYLSYFWETGDGHIYTNNNFEHSYQQLGYYYPVIHFKDSSGCEYTDTSKVEVRFFSVYIPNSFTPNGDGLNEIFDIQGEGIKSYTLYIYSRWGELIYTAEDHGWNGFYLRNPVQTGTYIYKAEIKDIFGRTYQKSGSVVLIR